MTAIDFLHKTDAIPVKTYVLPKHNWKCCLQAKITNMLI